MAVYFLSYGPNLVPVSRIIAENDPHLFPTRRRSTDNVMRTNFLIPVPKKTASPESSEPLFRPHLADRAHDFMNVVIQIVLTLSTR